MPAHIDLHGDDLDSRAREVLREIIMQHVATGEPISSRSLAKGGRFQLSPASLRNVMADLEDLGYLMQRRGFSRIRTPRPDASRPTAATASSSTTSCVRDRSRSASAR